MSWRCEKAEGRRPDAIFGCGTPFPEAVSKTGMQTLRHRQDTPGDRIRDWIGHHKLWSAIFAAAAIIGFAGYNAYSRFAYMQTPDLSYDTRVANPVYASDGPRVLFDAAHWNLHKPTTTYLPLANLIRNDGYRVDINRRAFTPETLRPWLPGPIRRM